LKLTNPETVFQLAANLERSAQLLKALAAPRATTAKSNSDAAGATPNTDPLGLIPVFINKAQSVELYLRCLHLIEKGVPAPHGRSLEDLFRLLSHARQEKIRHYYEELVQPRKPHNASDAAWIIASASVRDFDRMLKECSEGFAPWQKADEITLPSDNSLIMYLAKAVCQSVIELRPRWERHLNELCLPTEMPELYRLSPNVLVAGAGIHLVPSSS